LGDKAPEDIGLMTTSQRQLRLERAHCFSTNMALAWCSGEKVREIFAALDATAREAVSLGRRLRMERSMTLAGPVTLLAAVARQQVDLVVGSDLYPKPSPVCPEWAPPDLWEHAPCKASQLLGGHTNAIALALAGADRLSPTAVPRVRRCAGLLFQAVAQLEEALLAVDFALTPPPANTLRVLRPRAPIQLAVLEAVVKERRQGAQAEVCDAYAAMRILIGSSRRLSFILSLRRERSLVRPVAVATTVLRQQVKKAEGEPWLPPPDGNPGGWEPSLDWLRLPALDAVDALREELHAVASVLVPAVQFLPETWDVAISRCAGALLLVTAHLREVVEKAAPERQGEEEPLIS